MLFGLVVYGWVGVWFGFDWLFLFVGLFGCCLGYVLVGCFIGGVWV